MNATRVTAALVSAIAAGLTFSPSGLAQQTEQVFTLPGSDQRLTQRQIDNPYDPADWFPDQHPPMPDIVKYGDREKGLWACSLCHLASGYGHPESAALTGLSEEYLYQQLLAFKAWHRPDWSGAMLLFVWGHEDEDLRAAAEYFAAIEPGPVVRVVETEQVPDTHVDVAWRTKIRNPDDPKMVPLGQRIVTLPEDELRRTIRDPYAIFISYVPPGSIERGRRIAHEGTATSQPCITCHGADMRGTALGPYLAGQFPDYLLRQLRTFKWGTRRASGDEGGFMQQEARYLSEEDMIAVSAYIASLPRN